MPGSGEASFRVCLNPKNETLQAVATEDAAEETTVFTDENCSYLWLESGEESREGKAADPPFRTPAGGPAQFIDCALKWYNYHIDTCVR